MMCGWSVDEACLPAVPADDPAAALRMATAQELAVSVLWALSGRQFGACPVTVRPCVQAPAYDRMAGLFGFYGAPFFPLYNEVTDQWTNVGCGCGGGGCSEGGPNRVHLPGPIGEVLAVRIAGTLLDPDQYVVEGDVLYRVGAPWPSQDLGIPDGNPGTWSVTYTKGLPIPPGVPYLAGILTAEFYEACSGSSKCRIPRNVTQVSRKGVTYQIDTSAIYAAGRTGMPEIDLWLSSVNPNRLMAPPKVT